MPMPLVMGMPVAITMGTKKYVMVVPMPLVMGMPVAFIMGMKKKHIFVLPNGIAYCYSQLVTGMPEYNLCFVVIGPFYTEKTKTKSASGRAG